MEAFDRMGNHLVSDSASTINAGDDVSTVDADDTILSMAGGPRRRRHDDEDEGSDVVDADDLESMASVPFDGAGNKPAEKSEEETVLPSHACA